MCRLVPEDDKMQRRVDIALLAAVPKEIEGLADRLTPSTGGSVGGESFALCSYHSWTVLIGTLGFGKVNAAATMAALAERFDLVQVWHVGCAGAYADHPMQIGDVLITTRFVCGDEGILTASGELPTSSIGIPIVETNGQGYHDVLPVDQDLLTRIRTITPGGRYQLDMRTPRCTLLHERPMAPPTDAGPPAEGLSATRESFQVVYGPSVTVSLVSGDETVARTRSQRYRALAENMEGSAVAQTCLRFGIPVLECRGISNQAGDRRKDHWRMDPAIAHCHAVVLRWLSEALGTDDERKHA
jgi:futalosine hydrolase